MIIKLTESSFYLCVTQSMDPIRDHGQKYIASESWYRVKTAVLDPTRSDALSIASSQQYVCWMASAFFEIYRAPHAGSELLCSFDRSRMREI